MIKWGLEVISTIKALNTDTWLYPCDICVTAFLDS